MKNQDPTADTDPNEYINQLVNVNSLEQLIQINQTLTTDSGSTTTGSSGAATTGASGTATTGTRGAATTGSSTPVQPVSSGTTTNLPGALSAAANKLAPGNLGIPAANPAAQSVAQSLSGRPHK
jgi:flagellar basal-body rod modification protein FlgD